MTAIKRGAAMAAMAGLAVAATAGTLGVLSRRIEAAAPPQGRFIDIDGNAIHYVDQGPQTPDAAAGVIVLVHGLGGQLRNFTYGVVDRLAARHRVIALDRPGAGYSSRVADTEADLRSQADILVRLLDTLAIDQPLLVGHSMGGALAMAAALDNPGRFAGLALITPLVHTLTMPPSSLLPYAIRSSLLRRAFAWSAALPLLLSRRERTLAELFGPETAPADFPTLGGGALGLRPTMFYNTSTDMVALPQTLSELAERYVALDLPVSLLLATEDRILAPADHGERLAGVIGDLDIERVPGGHMLPITQPEMVADWIDRVADRALPQKTST